MSVRSFNAAWWAVAALSVVVACSDPERAERAGEEESSGGEASDDGPVYEVEIDESVVMALSFEYATNLERLTSEPEFSETHADAAGIHVWGTPGVAEKFHSVNPDDPSQAVTFDAGTHLVKEHLDRAGSRVGLTIMYKAPAGYNPTGGDWFWARVDGQTVTHSGRVDFCLECHGAAINSDFVVGFGKSD